ncbi:unnamed protein product [Closterium sp. NIES-53]
MPPEFLQDYTNELRASLQSHAAHQHVSQSDASSFIPPISHLPSPISHLPSPISHLPSPISHLPSLISHLPSPISHLPSPISHFPSPISYLSYLISHLSSPSFLQDYTNELEASLQSHAAQQHVSLDAIWNAIG